MTSDDFFENWEQAKTILAEMAAEGVKPDGVTLMNLLVRGLSICYFSFSSQGSSRLVLLHLSHNISYCQLKIDINRWKVTKTYQIRFLVLDHKISDFT
jgi:hypothetical protein